MNWTIYFNTSKNDSFIALSATEHSVRSGMLMCFSSPLSRNNKIFTCQSVLGRTAGFACLYAGSSTGLLGWKTSREAGFSYFKGQSKDFSAKPSSACNTLSCLRPFGGLSASGACLALRPLFHKGKGVSGPLFSSAASLKPCLLGLVVSCKGKGLRPNPYPGVRPSAARLCRTPASLRGKGSGHSGPFVPWLRLRRAPCFAAPTVCLAAPYHLPLSPFTPFEPKGRRQKIDAEKMGSAGLEENGSEFQKFFNQCFDKGRLKNFVLWFLLNYGAHKTVTLVEQLKNVGFEYASKAGISLGIDDLKIPPKKAELIYEAEKQTTLTVNQYVRGEITGVERFQRLIDTWHRTSEVLKQEVIDYFEATDILNPVYMMAFSGARGNVSQVRQLVGMRGLMADPQGQIIDFPIRSNFREGLTLTEYIISSYGARKGIVDTALRTANAGYLTRRLVDVAQHVIISNFDCGTRRGIFLINMKEGNKTIHSLSQRTVGRILARDLFLPRTPTAQLGQRPLRQGFSEADAEPQSQSLKGMHGHKQLKNMWPLLAGRNDEVTLDLAFEIGKHFSKVFVRSPLTCETSNLICQLCYGWSLAQGNLVSIGEAVGVVAAQSIGEPGTQLTMRTFHTGGVFSGDISDQIRAPFNGFVQYISAIPGTLIRTPEGKIAFLTKSEGSFVVSLPAAASDTSLLDQGLDNMGNQRFQQSLNNVKVSKRYKVPHFTLLYIRNGQPVSEKEVIAQISTISRKGNATDDAELTIKSDYEGQFYSKSLGFREKYIGPEIKSSCNGEESKGPFCVALPFSEGVMGKGFGPKGLTPTPRTVSMEGTPQGQRSAKPKPFESAEGLCTSFGKGQTEKIYEAWTWGYAWILSGKIYEANSPSRFFAQLGDYLNIQSCMSQTKYKININHGNTQKIQFHIPKHNFESAVLQLPQSKTASLYNPAKGPSSKSSSASCTCPSVTLAQWPFPVDKVNGKVQWALAEAERAIAKIKKPHGRRCFSERALGSAASPSRMAIAKLTRSAAGVMGGVGVRGFGGNGLGVAKQPPYPNPLTTNPLPLSSAEGVGVRPYLPNLIGEGALPVRGKGINPCLADTTPVTVASLPLCRTPASLPLPLGNKLNWLLPKGTPVEAAFPLAVGPSTNKNRLGLVSKQHPILNLDLKKIIFKQYGYIFELTEKVQFFKMPDDPSFSTHTKKNFHNQAFAVSASGPTVQKSNDLLFFMKNLKNAACNAFSADGTCRGASRRASLSLEKESDFILQWFPQTHETLTAGYIVLENTPNSNFANLSSKFAAPEGQESICAAFLPKGAAKGHLVGVGGKGKGVRPRPYTQPKSIYPLPLSKGGLPTCFDALTPVEYNELKKKIRNKTPLLREALGKRQKTQALLNILNRLLSGAEGVGLRELKLPSPLPLSAAVDAQLGQRSLRHRQSASASLKPKGQRGFGVRSLGEAEATTPTLATDRDPSGTLLKNKVPQKGKKGNSRFIKSLSKKYGQTVMKSTTKLPLSKPYSPFEILNPLLSGSYTQVGLMQTARGTSFPLASSRVRKGPFVGARCGPSDLPIYPCEVPQTQPKGPFTPSKILWVQSSFFKLNNNDFNKKYISEKPACRLLHLLSKDCGLTRSGLTSSPATHRDPSQGFVVGYSQLAGPSAMLSCSYRLDSGSTFRGRVMLIAAYRECIKSNALNRMPYGECVKAITNRSYLKTYQQSKGPSANLIIFMHIDKEIPLFIKTNRQGSYKYFNPSDTLNTSSTYPAFKPSHRDKGLIGSASSKPFGNGHRSMWGLPPFSSAEPQRVAHASAAGYLKHNTEVKNGNAVAFCGAENNTKMLVKFKASDYSKPIHNKSHIVKKQRPMAVVLDKTGKFAFALLALPFWQSQKGKGQRVLSNIGVNKKGKWTKHDYKKRDFLKMCSFNNFNTFCKTFSFLNQTAEGLALPYIFSIGASPVRSSFTGSESHTPRRKNKVLDSLVVAFPSAASKFFLPLQRQSPGKKADGGNAFISTQYLWHLPNPNMNKTGLYMNKTGLWPLFDSDSKNGNLMAHFIKEKNMLRKKVCDLFSSNYLKFEYGKYSLVKNKKKFNTFVQLDGLGGFPPYTVDNVQNSVLFKNILSLKMCFYLLRPNTKNVFLNQVYLAKLQKSYSPLSLPCICHKGPYPSPKNKTSINEKILGNTKTGWVVVSSKQFENQFLSLHQKLIQPGYSSSYNKENVGAFRQSLMRHKADLQKASAGLGSAKQVGSAFTVRELSGGVRGSEAAGVGLRPYTSPFGLFHVGFDGRSPLSTLAFDPFGLFPLAFDQREKTKGQWQREKTKEQWQREKPIEPWLKAAHTPIRKEIYGFQSPWPVFAECIFVPEIFDFDEICSFKDLNPLKTVSDYILQGQATRHQSKSPQEGQGQPFSQCPAERPSLNWVTNKKCRYQFTKQKGQKETKHHVGLYLQPVMEFNQICGLRVGDKAHLPLSEAEGVITPSASLKTSPTMVSGQSPLKQYTSETTSSIFHNEVKNIFGHTDLSLKTRQGSFGLLASVATKGNFILIKNVAGKQSKMCVHTDLNVTAGFMDSKKLKEKSRFLYLLCKATSIGKMRVSPSFKATKLQLTDQRPVSFLRFGFAEFARSASLRPKVPPLYKNVRYVVNQSFDSLYNWTNNRTPLFNKQKKTNQPFSKYATHDFSIISNPLLNTLTNNFKTLHPVPVSAKAIGPCTLLSNQLSMRFISRKPLNLSSFLITSSTLTLNNYNFSLKYQGYELSYQPLCRFDYGLYPFLVKSISYMLSFYLNKTRQPLLSGWKTLREAGFSNINDKYRCQSIKSNNTDLQTAEGPHALSYRQRPCLKDCAEMASDFYKTGVIACTHWPLPLLALPKVKGKRAKAASNKFYHNLKDLIFNIFESPCFSFNVHERLNLRDWLVCEASSTLRHLSGKGIRHKSEGLLTKQSALSEPWKTNFSYNYRPTGQLISYQTFAKTNHYSPFNGEIVYTRHNSLKGSAEMKNLENPLVSASYSEHLPVNSVDSCCMFLTKADLISYYLPSQYFKQIILHGFNESNQQKYTIQDTLVKFVNMAYPSVQSDTCVQLVTTCRGVGARSGVRDIGSSIPQTHGGTACPVRRATAKLKPLSGKAKQRAAKDPLIGTKPLSKAGRQLGVRQSGSEATVTGVGVGGKDHSASISGKGCVKTPKRSRGSRGVGWWGHSPLPPLPPNPLTPTTTLTPIKLGRLGHVNLIGNKGAMMVLPVDATQVLGTIKISKLNAGTPQASNLSLLGDFFVYGDPLSTTTALQTSGQIIHYNNQKITLRRAQPIFISPKGILRKFDGDFIEAKDPVITLSYQRLKTGDIIQGIPKVEQFFEARTTKRGRLFRDSLPSLLKALFKRYSSKLPLDLAVRQSFYKIQQIVVDGVQRVYKSQGVTISDKHLEVIVKQMTSKVRILDGAQTGFFPGEVVDLCFVEKINSFLIKKITYEPLVLGITKASLEVDSFLSAASFQQTTRVLSKAAIYRKKDFLKGLKENVILGNLIPAGTGYLVYLDDFSKE
uniref:DNA-directed RNA polymerase n=1 Tax=Hyalogonium fusiforme TaxID=2926373 RepID=A0A9E7V7I5_9CHLO|nr:RNA polymerase beta'' subunit [Hyalogonium fusiforme]